MVKYVFLLVVLVAAAGGGLAWNYQRNAHLEADLHKPRPYATIPTAELPKLIAAYQADIKRRRGGISAAPTGSDAIDRRDDSDVGGKADAFAGFQRQNESWKKQRGMVMEQEVELQKLQFEKSIRDRHLDDPKHVFKLRLLTF
jgi:hypothetical protein